MVIVDILCRENLKKDFVVIKTQDYRTQKQDTFCTPLSVSRVKVIDVNNPYEDHSGQFDVVYTIEHVYYYRMPNSYCKLPPLLLAKSNEAQRLNMTAGKEYILAGSNDCDMALRTSYDVQVNDDGIYGAQEWHNVSETLQHGLFTYNC
ncbi:unnamed protein product [Angiostrongylus costaricensis]|uniref:NTR domain-containing protein n=1 Tax=Angiostrongylus costaricensis TaxID=334426 RepID=A0A158PFI1_ANGCS|nr:unnamed protein product [Angiostrongylus costaricensis]